MSRRYFVEFDSDQDAHLVIDSVGYVVIGSYSYYYEAEYLCNDLNNEEDWNK